jgi:predicted hydrocarbon binding protein
MRVEPTEKDIQNVHKIYLDQSKIDYAKGQLKLGDLPIIWARADLLYDMYIELKKIVGDSANPLMRKMGRPYGRNFFRTLGRAFVAAHGKTDEEALLNFLAAENAVIGWGRISVERSGDRWIVISPTGFPVAQSFRSKKMYSTVPVDSYFLGYFEGFVSELSDVVYVGKETKCLALGDDVCQMVFEPRDKDNGPPKQLDKPVEPEPDFSE